MQTAYRQEHHGNCVCWYTDKRIRHQVSKIQGFSHNPLYHLRLNRRGDGLALAMVPHKNRRNMVSDISRNRFCPLFHRQLLLAKIMDFQEQGNGKDSHPSQCVFANNPL